MRIHLIYIISSINQIFERIRKVCRIHWPRSNRQALAGFIFIQSSGAYFGISFNFDDNGQSLVTVSSADGGTTKHGGFGGSVISAGGWE